MPVAHAGEGGHTLGIRLADHVVFRDFGDGIIAIKDEEEHVLNEPGKLLFVSLYALRQFEDAQVSGKVNRISLSRRIRAVLGPELCRQILMWSRDAEPQRKKSEFPLGMMSRIFDDTVLASEIEAFLDSLIEAGLIERVN